MASSAAIRSLLMTFSVRASGRDQFYVDSAETQSVAGLDRNGRTGRDTLAVDECTVGGADLLAQEQRAALAQQLGVAPAQAPRSIERPQIDLRRDPGDRI